MITPRLKSDDFTKVSNNFRVKSDHFKTVNIYMLGQFNIDGLIGNCHFENLCYLYITLYLNFITNR